MFTKKFYLKFLLGLLLMAVTVPQAQADELTVANTTSTDYQVPLYGSWMDTQGTYSQTIYTASQLSSMAGQSITSVTYYPSAALSSNFNGCVLQVSMKEVSQTGFSETTPIDGLTACGTCTLKGGETSVVIEFDDPFIYSGQNSLVVEVRVATGTGYATVYWYAMTTEGSEYCTIYHYSTTTSRSYKIPMTTFTYESAVSEPYSAKVTPESLSFGSLAVGGNSTKDVTLKNNGQNSFTYTLSGLSTPFSTTASTTGTLAAGTSVTIPVKYEPTAEGDFTGNLNISFAESELSAINVPLTGSAANEMTVCGENTTTSNYLPVYGYFYDEAQHNQMIYPESMLEDLVGSKIKSITFYANTSGFSGGNIDLRLATTDQSSFTEATHVSVSGNALGSVVPSANASVLTFDFAEPFEYNGGNLLVDIQTTAGTFGSSSYVAVSHTGGGVRQYGSSSAIKENYLPKMTIGYEPGSVTPVYSLEVTDPTTGTIDFGTVNVGQSGTATVTIKNTGNTAVTPALSTSNGCFTVTSTETGELAKNATRTYNITFTPTEETNYSATLTVADADGLVTVTPTVDLTGAGHELAAYAVTVSEASGAAHNFGEVAVGHSGRWTINVKNDGSSTVTPTLSGITDPYSAVSVQAIGIGEETNIVITFNPNEVKVYDPVTVTLTFPEANGAISTYTYTLNGTGIEDTSTKPASFYEGIEYTWKDSEGTEHTNNLGEIATDPDQMIALMKEVYTNKDIPGNLYRGHKADGSLDTDYEVAYPAIGKIANNYSNGAYSLDFSDSYGWGMTNDAENYPMQMEDKSSSTYYNYYHYLNPNEYKPNEEGVTLLLVEMKDGVTENTVAKTSTDYASLRNIFDKMFKSVRVITHSRKYGEGDEAGTLFKIDCDKMNRFFFLAKGRLRLYNTADAIASSSYMLEKKKISGGSTSYSFSTNENGPFYEMFEQFSPVSLTSGTNNAVDIYQKLVNMEAFYVEHDCETVPWATSTGNNVTGHEFNMYGKESISDDCQDVRDLMFFVPDYRMKWWFTNYSASRDGIGTETATDDMFKNYNLTYAPTMGLYVIRQNTITGEKNNGEDVYTLHLSWESNLNTFLPSAEGTYYIYQVNDDGTYTLVGTTDANTTTLDVEVAMQPHGQQVTYVIQGQDNSRFLSLQMSNEESFIIPGTDPYEKFQLNPNADYYSRFDPAQETNFYANGMQIKAYPDVNASDFVGQSINFFRKASTDTEWTKVATATVNSGATSAAVSMVDATQRQQSEYMYGYKTNASSVTITTDNNAFETFGNIYDNFKADVSENTHPDYYKYKVVVDGTPDDANKVHSNEITIRVYKTQMSTIDGTFTQAQVNNDTEHTLGLKSTAFNIEVEHSSKTEILRYDAYRWTEGTDYYIIDQSSDPDDEQDIAPNGIAGNQGTSYTTAMNNDYTGSVNVAQGQTAQAPFEDSYPEEHIGAYTYAPVVEVFAPTGWGRDDYNTYGAPLQTTATGKTELTVGEKKASNYTFQINNVDYVYYQIPLTATVTIPQDKGYEIYKIRAWRVIDETKVGKNFLGEIDPDFAERADYDYLFEEIDDASAGQQGIPIGTTAVTTDDPNQVNVTTGTFGAKKLADGQSFTVQFIVRTYFTKPTRDNEGGDYFISQTIVDVPIDSDITTGIVNVKGEKQVAGVKYYNLAGMESDSPFNGVNIVVTRYTDGSTSTSKVLK